MTDATIPSVTERTKLTNTAPTDWLVEHFYLAVAISAIIGILLPLIVMYLVMQSEHYRCNARSGFDHLSGSTNTGYEPPRHAVHGPTSN